MKTINTILSISGSDSTGGTGIQGDIKTISALGAYAVTVLTSVAVQNSEGIHSVFYLPNEVVEGQLRSVLNDISPRATKVGLLGNEENIDILVRQLKDVENVVCAPGIVSSRGELLVSEEAVGQLLNRLLPLTEILVIKLQEAKILSRHSIKSNEELEEAGRMLLPYGVKNVLLLGGRSAKGLLTNVLVSKESVNFFTLPESENWKTHGMSGTMSSAIATLLGQGLSVCDAVESAHEYLKRIVLLSVKLHHGKMAKMIQGDKSEITYRQAEIYNGLMQLVATHCHNNHDVLFYANKLCVSSRYLSQVTNRIVGKSPKQLIDEYLLQEVERQILCTQKTIQEICFEYGFSSQSQFSKFFKKMKGQSPSNYR